MSYTPCPGSGTLARKLWRSPGTPPGLGNSPSPGKTFGECVTCGYTVMVRGFPASITVPRHKQRKEEE